MKIIKLKHSILFLRIDTELDTATALFLFFVSWNIFKLDKSTFDLNQIPVSKIKILYNNISNEWIKKYKL